tara:strand:+ start:7059 stop:7589 length:531 start_codon:yes stop_codon:yes gene_type:complete
MKSLLITMLFGFSAMAAEVDLKKSSFNWKGTKVSGEHVGTIDLKSANLKMDDGKIKSGEFVIDINSVDVTDLEGKWKKKLEDHLKSDDFFSADKYPTAKLKINKADDQHVYGDLTIRDKSHSVKIPYTKSGKTYSGTLTFDRTKFDMKYNSGNFFKNLGDKMIHDEVNVGFKIVLK